MMLSSQRPYTNSSLSMGKMENQGQSSSCEAAVTETQINKKRTFKNIYNDKLYIFDVKRKIKTTKKLTLTIVDVFVPFGSRECGGLGHGGRRGRHQLGITPDQTYNTGQFYFK